MRSLDVEAYADAVSAGAIVVDTRPWELVARDPIPGALHVPLDRVREGRLPEVPHDAEVIVLCEWGRKSELAGLYLEAHGFTRIHHLAGGVAALRRAHGLRDARPGKEPR
jgi:adenylyltransferase/sulfurtransferase